MTEEPYRWLEAVANRRDYVREQLAGAAPVFAASLNDGILMLGVGAGQSKVFEIHDRLGLAGLGHPADIEKIRQAAIDTAHIEAFARASEDVSLRRLVSFGLGPLMKTQFEQIFSAPYLVELLIAELGSAPEKDLVGQLHFDGSFQFRHGGVAVAGANTNSTSAACDWLSKQEVSNLDWKAMADRILQAWWLMRDERFFTDNLPDEPERRAGWQEAAKEKTIELGWLNRLGPKPARFQMLDAAEL